ncbi:hypothetical protein AMTR_s00028p00104290 [Amborella trichopoda]|uniref:Beta-glucosidase n=1 Tax=Amborella trichopoda TaxID=13333 RepID=W1PS88_AMBTC|nr:hypothetical protein AMTR_s00028p00104290 [Amborella trichopoda]
MNKLQVLRPFVLGYHPSSMKTQVGNHLPQFSKAQSALIKGSLDFVGINHYITYYAQKKTPLTLLVSFSMIPYETLWLSPYVILIDQDFNRFFEIQ